jgi:GT2 family glycosyltransferase
VHNFYSDDPSDIRDGFYVRPAYPNEHPYVHAIDVAGHAINSLYKKATLIRVGGFDETLMYAEDYDLHLRLGELGARMAVVGQSLVKHRCRSKPRTFTMEDLMEKAFQLLRDSAERMKGSRVFEDDLFRRHLSTKFWHMARLLSESNKPDSAYEAFAYSRELYRQDCPMGSPFYKITYRVFGFRFAEYLRMKKRSLS